MQKDAFYSLKGCLRVLKVFKDIKDFNLLLSYAEMCQLIFFFFLHTLFSIIMACLLSYYSYFQ